MAEGFSSNNSRPRPTTRVRSYKPQAYRPMDNRTPEQKRQDRTAKLRQEVNDLHQRKAEMRSRAQQRGEDINSPEFRAKMSAYDSKITSKMQRAREAASNFVQKAKEVAGNTIEKAKEVAGTPKQIWDDWEI